MHLRVRVCTFHMRASFSWLEPMLSMAMGLFGALHPDMSCSVRMRGECRGGGAEDDPPGGTKEGGGEGCTTPATAWTVFGRAGRRERERSGVNVVQVRSTRIVRVVGHL